MAFEELTKIRMNFFLKYRFAFGKSFNEIIHRSPMGSYPFDQLENRYTFRLAAEGKILLCLRRSTDLLYI
jgi:hypothetical protein